MSLLRKIILFIVLMLVAVISVSASNTSMSHLDSVSWMRPDTMPRRSFLNNIGHGFMSFIKAFNDIDTTYIEPNKYKFTAMLQNTNTYEIYRLSTKEGQNITFSPDFSYRVGPYIGWRFIFLGYTFDIKHIKLHNKDSQRQEYDLSLYSSMFGIDLYYRETGNDYHISSLSLGESQIDTDPVIGSDFDGVKSSIKGFNIYYVFNHKRFSYPAAFSQSTVQRRSAGTPILGIGYTRHKLTVDWDALNHLVDKKLGHRDIETKIDSSLMFGTIKYTDISLSSGYAYNWVFARNWLLSGSLSVGLAYNRSTGDMDHKKFSIRDFSFNNINLDGILRAGLVYNNSKWYAGASSILHAYNYHRSRFSTNNFFGSINFYVGFNFGMKKEYRNTK
jgi:hypothetical protein